MKKRFIVERVVSDYGVFDTLMPKDNQLDCICSAMSNAEIIADILNVDYSKPNECTYWKDQQIFDLQKENEVLRRSLELACDELDTWHRSCDNRPDYFIQQAKEMLNKCV